MTQKPAQTITVSRTARARLISSSPLARVAMRPCLRRSWHHLHSQMMRTCRPSSLELTLQVDQRAGLSQSHPSLLSPPSISIPDDWCSTAHPSSWTARASVRPTRWSARSAASRWSSARSSHASPPGPLGARDTPCGVSGCSGSASPWRGYCSGRWARGSVAEWLVREGEVSRQSRTRVAGDGRAGIPASLRACVNVKMARS